jgi:hypothetical protein
MLKSKKRFERFKEFLAFVETQLEHKIKAVWRMNDKELLFERYLDKTLH